MTEVCRQCEEPLHRVPGTDSPREVDAGPGSPGLVPLDAGPEPLWVGFECPRGHRTWWAGVAEIRAVAGPCPDCGLPGTHRCVRVTGSVALTGDEAPPVGGRAEAPEGGP